MPSWDQLDLQMRGFQIQLIDVLKVDKIAATRLATMISSEIRFLGRDTKDQIRNASPVTVEDRITELKAFQGWMDLVDQTSHRQSPYIVRAQVITQNYICFCYLPEACFLLLRKIMPVDSTTRKCAKFLTDNPVRAFRNAVAHANWTYETDFSGIKYWARKGSSPDEPLEQFSVKHEDLDFWQALSRCIAYSVFSNL